MVRIHVALDCGDLEPQITWGTDPSQVVGVGGRVPELAAPGQEAAYRRALDYMRLTPGMQVAAEIHLGQRSVIEYLLSPIQKVAQEAGRER